MPGELKCPPLGTLKWGGLQLRGFKLTRPSCIMHLLNHIIFPSLSCTVGMANLIVDNVMLSFLHSQ